MVFLILVAAAMGGWAAWEQRQKSALTLELDSTRQELEALRAAKTADPLLPETRESVESSVTASEATEPQPAADQPKPESPMSAMAEIMQDPGMLDMMKVQMRSGIEMLYNDLFDLMELDDSTRDAVMKILVERSTAGMDMGFAMMAGSDISDEESARTAEEVAALHKESESQLKELLGSEGYVIFERYEKSQPERQQLKVLSSQLRTAGMPLSEDAEASLMDAMFEERMDFKYDVDFPDQNTALDPSAMTKPHSDRYFEQQEQLQKKVILRAESILSPEQMDVFRAALEQQRAFEKMSMEMGLKMLGRDGE